ncbi:MAG: type IV secretory system conjugative DNA transfer family protein [Desulfosporosinus sp.]|nr:type IV secretory system conjugative DNA transfer family protein [Desulfosporosinus sp.]
MSRLYWGGDDPFTHTMIVGPTRCGKTATLIKPIIYQILLAKARGVPCGLSIIEPKGDVAQFAVDLARELGIKAYQLDPTRETSDKINLMKGPVNDVSEATIAVLKGMFGKQEAFFQLVQELTARNFIKLVKLNHGDNLDILSVLRTLRDNAILEREQKMLEKSGKDPDLSSFFTNEMQGKLGAKWKDLALGLRAQIENIVSNEDLKRIITGDSGINLDQHMAEGGVIGINTALGKLKRSGDAFGQFMAMHLQSAAFRRPGTEKTRIPHYLIIDEMSRYINADTEKFLSIAAEYRVAGIFAVQSFSQLEIGAGDLTPKAMKTAVLTNCRNKISFGGITYDDAEYFANELGKNWEVMRQNTYDGFALASFLPKTYRDTEQEEYRIRPTDIQDGLPRFHYIHKLLRDGHPMKPGIALGQFVPSDWQEKARNTNNPNYQEKDEAPQKRGLFSLLKKHMPQPLKGGESASSTQLTESVQGSIPMNDSLNAPKEPEKIKVKTKRTLVEPDVNTQPPDCFPKMKLTSDQSENYQSEHGTQADKAPNQKPEKKQVSEDQSSEEPFVFM